VDLKAIEPAFAELALAQLHKRELITDDDVLQILSQDHIGFGVWLGAPFHDKQSGMNSPCKTPSSRPLMTSETRFLCDGTGVVYLECYFQNLAHP
jgi:hypothetical protein